MLYDLTCRVCGERFQAMWAGMGAQPSCGPCTAALKRASDERKNVARRGRPHNLAYSKEYNFRRYGITREKFDVMFAAQNGACAVCKKPANPGVGPATQRLHIDHNHDTGRVRGLLCLNCNRALGWFQDDPQLLRRAAEYLEEDRRWHIPTK